MIVATKTLRDLTGPDGRSASRRSGSWKRRADVLLTAATPKFAAQAIRKVYDIGWKPTHLLTNVSVSVGSVMKPAGPEKGVGIISAGYLKDPTDPQWQNGQEYKDWLEWMKKNYSVRQPSPTSTTCTDTPCLSDYGRGPESGRGDNLTRENVK